MSTIQALYGCITGTKQTEQKTKDQPFKSTSCQARIQRGAMGAMPPPNHEKKNQFTLLICQTMKKIKFFYSLGFYI